jgi:hypothetical protein
MIAGKRNSVNPDRNAQYGKKARPGSAFRLLFGVPDGKKASRFIRKTQVLARVSCYNFATI